MTLDFRQIEDNQWEVFRTSPAVDKPIGLIRAKDGEYSFFPYVWQQPLELDYAALRGVTHYCDYLKQKTAPAETHTKEPCPRCGEQDYLLNLCGKCVRELVRNADSIKTEATAEPTETKTKGDAAADLDTVAERILNVFTDESDTRTDADLLAASGLNREEYLDVRDFLLIETEEISETAEDTAPTEYIRNWPRKAEAAA